MALARLDYCRVPDAVPAVSDQLSCTLRARQCGSHISATQDRRWLGLASGPLGVLLEPASVTGWAGTDDSSIDVEASGVCNLMSSDRYGEAFWKSTGRARSALVDEAVLNAQSGIPPRRPPPETDAQLFPPRFGSVEWLLQHYN